MPDDELVCACGAQQPRHGYLVRHLPHALHIQHIAPAQHTHSCQVFVAGLNRACAVCLIFLMAFTLLPSVPLHTSPSTPTPSRFSSFSLQAHTHADGQLMCSACCCRWPGVVDVGDAPSPLLLLIADVLHLHRHLASQVVLQGILATVGVVPVQAEGAPEL